MLAIALDEKAVGAWKERGKAYYRTKEYERAENDIDRALALSRKCFSLPQMNIRSLHCSLQHWIRISQT